jgi:ethanolamine ammonia-lyase large subunit
MFAVLIGKRKTKFVMEVMKMKGQKKEYERKRNNQLCFWVDDNEREQIYKRMKDASVGSLRAFLLKMALNGRIIRVELDSVNEMIRLLSNATNNINQIARRVNETGNIYSADIDDLRDRYEELWGQVKEILRRLARV